MAKTARPYAEEIIQWAKDTSVQIQYYNPNTSSWVDTSVPTWDVNLQWRVKPSVKYYRVYLAYNANGNPSVFVLNVAANEMAIAADPTFIRWLSDWQPVDVQ